METAAGKASVKQTGSLTTSVNSWKSATYNSIKSCNLKVGLSPLSQMQLLIFYTAVLLLQEAGLENDAAALNLAVNLFRILCKTDASYFGATLDDH